MQATHQTIEKAHRDQQHDQDQIREQDLNLQVKIQPQSSNNISLENQEGVNMKDINYVNKQWGCILRLRYLIFLIMNRQNLQSQQFKKKEKISSMFQSMSLIVGSKSKNLCLLFHNKCLRKYQSIGGIIKNLRQTLQYDEQDLERQKIRIKQIIKLKDKQILEMIQKNNHQEAVEENKSFKLIKFQIIKQVASQLYQEEQHQFQKKQQLNKLNQTQKQQIMLQPKNNDISDEVLLPLETLFIFKNSAQSNQFQTIQETQIINNFMKNQSLSIVSKNQPNEQEINLRKKNQLRKKILSSHQFENNLLKIPNFNSNLEQKEINQQSNYFQEDLHKKSNHFQNHFNHFQNYFIQNHFQENLDHQSFQNQIQELPRKIRRKDVNKRKPFWTKQQTIKFLIFLNIKKQYFLSIQDKNNQKIYQLCSQYVGNKLRTPNVCKRKFTDLTYKYNKDVIKMIDEQTQRYQISHQVIQQAKIKYSNIYSRQETCDIDLNFQPIVIKNSSVTQKLHSLQIAIQKIINKQRRIELSIKFKDTFDQNNPKNKQEDLIFCQQIKKASKLTSQNHFIQIKNDLVDRQNQKYSQINKQKRIPKIKLLVNIQAQNHLFIRLSKALNNTKEILSKPLDNTINETLQRFDLIKNQKTLIVIKKKELKNLFLQQEIRK